MPCLRIPPAEKGASLKTPEKGALTRKQAQNILFPHAQERVPTEIPSAKGPSMSVQTLPNRKKEVLREVVNTFIETAEPVGSRTVSGKTSHPMSPSTIRNIMSDLSDMGYLTQPHVSAGRLPTDLGYRVFVDDLMGTHLVTEGERETIHSGYGIRSAQLEQVLSQVSRVLSDLTNQAGVILLPSAEKLQFRHIEFIRMAVRKVLVVIVAESGLVQHRIVQIDEDIQREELERISWFLNEEFAGLSLREIRKRVLQQMNRERAQSDDLYRQARMLSLHAFPEEESGVDEDSVFVEGSSRVYSQPDFAEDTEKLKNLYRAFEEKEKLIHLLDQCMESESLCILIGTESQIAGMEECSIVAQNYYMDSRSLGTIGLIGPKRMDYPRVVSLVDLAADSVSRFISSEKSF